MWWVRCRLVQLKSYETQSNFEGEHSKQKDIKLNEKHFTYGVVGKLSLGTALLLGSALKVVGSNLMRHSITNTTTQSILRRYHLRFTCSYIMNSINALSVC